MNSGNYIAILLTASFSLVVSSAQSVKGTGTQGHIPVWKDPGTLGDSVLSQDTSNNLTATRGFSATATDSTAANPDRGPARSACRAYPTPGTTGATEWRRNGSDPMSIRKNSG